MAIRYVRAGSLGAMVFGAVLSLGCSDKSDDVEGSTNSSVPEVLAAPAPGKGVQLRMQSDLTAGVETERCMFYVTPPGGLAVNREEVRYTPGSHHVLLFTTPYTEIPTQDRFGNDVDTHAIFECGEHGPTAHWSVNGVAGGAQSAQGAPIVANLPADTAFVIPAGTILLMNTHYLNASEQTLTTDARINLYTVPPEQVKQEAGILFFYDPYIYLPSGMDGTAREVCPIRKDIQLLNAQSHMHRRGVGYLAQLLGSDGGVQGELYSGTEWEDVALRSFSPPQALTAGQSIDFACHYSNQTDHTIIQGLSTRDEMCMFLGLYYPRDRQTELCGLGDSWDKAFVAARWIGNGNQAGAQTAACFSAAKDSSEDAGASFFACVNNSCPAISATMSNAARCLSTKGLGQCSTECSQSAAACRTCIGQKCGDLMTVLSTATCE